MCHVICGWFSPHLKLTVWQHRAPQFGPMPAAQQNFKLISWWCWTSPISNCLYPEFTALAAGLQGLEHKEPSASLRGCQLHPFSRLLGCPSVGRLKLCGTDPHRAASPIYQNSSMPGFTAQLSDCPCAQSPTTRSMIPYCFPNTR